MIIQTLCFGLTHQAGNLWDLVNVAKKGTDLSCLYQFLPAQAPGFYKDYKTILSHLQTFLHCICNESETEKKKKKKGATSKEE